MACQLLQDLAQEVSKPALGLVFSVSDYLSSVKTSLGEIAVEGF
jgi:hypothetical protein